MKLANSNIDRENYLKTQIRRSREKFSYCKVSYNHVLGWKFFLKKNNISPSKIICMGTRNGREIDLFRIVFFNQIRLHLCKLLELNRNGWTGLIPFIEKIGRTKLGTNDKSVYGCELNPDDNRNDVWHGSFDELPKEWENKFDLLYSNSFDQSLDPHKTAEEWLRCVKPGGVIIISFTNTPPTESDPVGFIELNDIMQLFPGELIFYGKNNSNYNDAIIKI